MSASLDRALILLQQSRPELAEKELRGVLVAEPESPVAHAFLALCLVELDRPDEATAEAREAVRLAPDFHFAHAAMARVFLKRERLKEAEAAILEAIRLDPDEADHYALLASVRFNRRRWSEALEAAEQGLAIDAEHVGCNNLRAMALVKLGRREEAGRTIDSALARDPDNAVTHANRGWTLLDEGDPRQALHHFREALRLEPEMEWARAGIVEALKARNPIYRLMLRYFLWMAKRSRGMQVVVILALIFGRRAIAAVREANPALAPIATLALYLLFAFVVLTWIAVPLFNLLLRLDRFGRYALTDDQVAASNWLGACLLATLGCLAAFLVTGDSLAWDATVCFFLLLLPLGGALQCEPGQPRLIMGIATAALAAIGPGAILYSAATGAPVPDISRLFIPGVVLSTWGGVILGQMRGAR